ncbi:MAG: hypothetical protein SPG61_02895 [Arcanobacterium sp.]|nr:hypothetical protein [Arcanobacterium sp.]
MKTTIKVFTLCFSLVLCVTGCSETNNSQYLPKSTSNLTVDSISTYPGATNGIGDGALLDGTLDVLSGCLVVTNNDSLIIPIFAAEDIKVSNGTLYLQNTPYSLGKKVKFGGGGLENTDYLSDNCKKLKEEKIEVSQFLVHNY